MAKLTVRKVEALSQPGMHGDGAGLYLNVSRSGSKSWILRTVVHGRRRDLGLGSASLVKLAEAREIAQTYRKIAREGGDPDILRKRETITFEEAAKRVHKDLSPTWRNEKHRTSWLASVEAYAYPHIKDRPLHTVCTADMLKILSPIWTEKHETAKRVRQRLSTIFDWAKGAGHYPNENPINGVGKALPRVKRRPEHMAAMPWQSVPAFMSELAFREGVSARCLEFLILTASRSGEARGTRWSEIDGNVWTVPGERMKRGLSHRVPICVEAIAILEKVRGLDADFVFPSPNRNVDGKGKAQSDMVFKSLQKRMGREGFTIHGFRSSFRDWCSESAKVDREVAEAALSHAIGNKVERSYARSDLFERRMALMEAWGRFASNNAGEVVQLVRA